MRRRHEVIAHTADVGLRAWADDLAGLFEEAALALAELVSEIEGVTSADGRGADAAPAADSRPDGRAEPIELEADDLVGLAYAWLNELVGRAQAAEEALVGAEVGKIAEAEPGRGWTLRGRARFIPYGGDDGRQVRPSHDVKSATYHRLAVRRQRGGWTLTAYLDV